MPHQTCILCGKLLFPAEKEGDIQWMECRNPNCIIPFNKQKEILEDED